jgi:hypothetical protein
MGAGSAQNATERSMRKMLRLRTVCLAALFCVNKISAAQQIADNDFKPSVGKAAFPTDKGPVVLVDEAHFNFHTASGRYQPFANLLRRDGYRVKSSTAKFSRGSLSGGRILVVANALGERNQGNWNPPIDDAFSDAEIRALHDWVNEGGALLLIVDHLPFPNAAKTLALAFGVHLENGIAISGLPWGEPGPDLFTRQDGALADHAITRGRIRKERVESVATFTGSAFKVDKGDALLTFVNPQAYVVTPRVFGQPPDNDTPRIPIHGWLQGAVLRIGKGRVAVFGEAAMFSAQVTGPGRLPVGMNAPIAKQNAQFALNVLHWLSGVL